MFDSTFEKVYRYEPDVDYDEVVQQFNKTIEMGDKQERNALLIRHGGIYSLLAKREYQQYVKRRIH